VTSTREIGFAAAVALVMGNMIGSGVFLLPASLAPYGGLSIVGWLITATGSVLIALVFARLARIHPAAGGLYAYTRRAFGDLPGFLVAWGYWISAWSANAALAVAFVGYLTPFFPTLATSPAAGGGAAIAALWLLTAVNLAGIRAAARVQIVTTVLKILPLVIVGIAGLVVLDPSHFAVTPAEGTTIGASLFAVMTLTLWAFLGLEVATIPAGSIKDPSRTIPRATMTGVLLAAVLYLVATIGVMGVIAPSALGGSSAPFADAARTLFGDRAAALVALGAAISCFGALNGWILVASQLPLAVARDGLFPSAFARVSPWGTPTVGLIVAGVLTTGLIAANYSRGLVALFTFIILLSTLSTLVPYVFCSLASFLTAEPGAERRARAVPAGAATIAGLAFVYAIAAIGGAGQETVYWGFLLLLAGLPVYTFVVTRARAGTPLSSTTGNR
jgi:APA family basic amino acid/polyamine antiporter